jgi:peptide methionine sulfoxide reductase MsrB
MTFSRSISKDKNIERVPDNRFNMKRTEARCKNCLSHLGHIFQNSVSGSGEAFVINSVALDFNFENYKEAQRKFSIQSL